MSDTKKLNKAYDKFKSEVIPIPAVLLVVFVT